MLATYGSVSGISKWINDEVGTFDADELTNGQSQADGVLTNDAGNECVTLQGDGFQIGDIPSPPASPSDPAPVFNGAPNTTTTTSVATTPSTAATGPLPKAPASMNGITVATTYTGLDEASNESEYDLFTGSCQTFIATYQFNGMGVPGPAQPTTVLAGQVVMVGTTTPLAPPLPGGVQGPGVNQAGVFRNGSYLLVSYQCGS
jgi:hypothetical protein